MQIEIRFIGASDKGRDKRLIDTVRECRDLAEAERWAREVLAKAKAKGQPIAANVKRIGFLVSAFAEPSRVTEVERAVGFIDAEA